MRFLGVLLLLASLSGCALLTQEEAVETENDRFSVTEIGEQAHWLQTAHDYMALSPEQALARITRLPSSGISPFERYRYALLNQQLRDRAGWIRARDTLRALAKDKELAREFRWLAEILLGYNQAMINAEARRHQMAEELADSQTAQQELKDKIRALTNLEQDISVRKGKTAEARSMATDE